MKFSSSALRIAGSVSVLFTAVVVASCSSGSSSTPAPISTASATAPSTSSTTPASGATTPPGSSSTPTPGPTSVATTGALTASVTFPTVAGYGATLTFSPAPNPNGVSVNLVGYNYAPAGVPTNPPNSQPSPTAGKTATVVAAWTFVAAGSGTITVPSPSEVFTGLSAAPAGTAYYTYFADITAGMGNGYGSGGTGGAQESGGSLTIPSSGSGATLTEGHTYALELVYF